MSPISVYDRTCVQLALFAAALILSEPFGLFEAAGTVLIIGSAVLSELSLKISSRNA